ncbi:MAG: hypothetical protein Q9167_006236 [Letrouitia subvulpina]
MHNMQYSPPLALTILSSISIGLGALAALCILVDIIMRRGWRLMMIIMIPVYVINALYLWPITFWTYVRFGRPEQPTPLDNTTGSHCAAHDHGHHHVSSTRGSNDIKNHHTHGSPEPPVPGAETAHHHHDHENHDHSSAASSSDSHKSQTMRDEERVVSHQHHDHHHHHSTLQRSLFATITIAVTHCGAGCVLGDIVGEWLIYGTGATIAGRELYAAFLIDFAFALVFGIVFQYFSIAPMAGTYGLGTVYRAAKADVLSLLFFEIGVFGWMAAFQVGIFGWRLGMDNVVYWWMMQVSSFHQGN